MGTFFGKNSKGEDVNLYTIKNKNAMRVSFLDLGAAVYEIWVEDKNGQSVQVSATYDDALLYEKALKEGGTEAAAFVAKGAYNGFMPFKDAKGRDDAEGAIWQFLGGRKASNVQFFPKKVIKNAKQ